MFPMNYWLLFLMQQNKIVPVNGSFTPKGNYLWGGALTLAWKMLSSDIIKEPIQINSKDPNALKMVDNFNNSHFTKKCLSEKDYYTRAGFGNPTVRLINEQVKQKFPDKTTEPIPEDLQPDSIIAYAYFLKKLLFHVPFQKKDVHFKGKQFAGFHASSMDHKKQILINQYKDSDNFMVELVTKAEKDQMFLIKNTKKLSPEDVLNLVDSSKSGEPMSNHDLFEMPKISLKYKRNVKQLLNVPLKNEKFEAYFFSKIYEIIKLDIDQTGAKVENEGVIVMSRSMRPVEKKEIILDKPFWIVMRQGKNHPYFVAFINELQEDSQ